MNTLLLTSIKFPAVGDEVATFLAAAPRAGCNVRVTTRQGFLTSQRFIELEATDRPSQVYVGNIYRALREVGRA